MRQMSIGGWRGSEVPIGPLVTVTAHIGFGIGLPLLGTAPETPRCMYSCNIVSTTVQP